MAWVFRISEFYDLTFVRWWGKMDVASYRDFLTAYRTHPLFRPGRSEFIDLSEVDEVDLNFQAVMLLMRELNTPQDVNPAHTRCVFWAPSDVPFGVGRMFEQLSDMDSAYTIEVHRDEFAALVSAGFPCRSAREFC